MSIPNVVTPNNLSDDFTAVVAEGKIHLTTTFEMLAQNLKARPHTVVDNGTTIVKTWNTSAGDIVLTTTLGVDGPTSKVFSGTGLPASLTQTTKTYTYPPGAVYQASYS